MHLVPTAGLALVFGAIACGASYPVPTERMVDAKAAAKIAEDGAQSNPRALLHLKLAHEEIARADALIASGENRRADYVLVRAKGDADLALALVKDASARQEAQQAVDKANAMRMQNSGGADQAPGSPPMVAPSTGKAGEP